MINLLTTDPDERPVGAISRMLTVSTGNVPKADMEALEALAKQHPDMFWNREYGLLVHKLSVPPWKQTEAMRKVFKLAERRGCDWIMFDVDADPHPGLTLWNW